MVHSEQIVRRRLRTSSRRSDAGGRRRGAHRSRQVLRGRDASGARCIIADGYTNHVHGRAARLSPEQQLRGRRDDRHGRGCRRTARVPRDTVRYVFRGGCHVFGRHVTDLRRAARASRHCPLRKLDRSHRLPFRVVRHAGRHHARSPHVRLQLLCRCRYLLLYFILYCKLS